ncbi:molybdopterin-dependent oxidoreductase [Falsirhodobacter sp. alg1]|uniref:molybdopterin-dependent oxidoreductase n=1 Tax=Falsirhodobacter sp. alg1 TaxID=1472418 RepID=UPI00078971D0|nr:molybdopterin-dependent oxidoreductase [Falsirhodobacter sp. alg1]
MQIWNKMLAVAFAAITLVWGPLRAEELPAPAGEVLLTVSGQITNTNVGDTAQFDRAALEAMGMVDIVTKSPWYDDRMTFTGVPVSVLLEKVGAHGTQMTVTALNDYEVKIPLEDADTGVILAMKLNGRDMSVREKGPIFIIYPYSSSERLRAQTYYARSSWQVSRIEIR